MANKLLDKMPSITKKKKPGRPSKGEPDVPTSFINVEIPVPLKEWLRKFARENDRNISAEVRRALREYRERHGNANPPSAGSTPENE